MPELTLEEIKDLIQKRKWGTLMAIDGNKPYGVELAYTFDSEYIYFAYSRPNGRISGCIRENPNVAFKICEADKRARAWRTAIIEGKAEKVTEPEDISRVFRSLAKKLELPENFYDAIVESFSNNPVKSTLYRLPVKEVGGKCKTEEKGYNRLLES
jgi:nitroimidazol reductase NimA-like FMN-containing flavoprotein (pyridoxamine 5'-phosphate oxidase superfamily)